MDQVNEYTINASRVERIVVEEPGKFIDVRGDLYRCKSVENCIVLRGNIMLEANESKTGRILLRRSAGGRITGYDSVDIYGKGNIVVRVYRVNIPTRLLVSAIVSSIAILARRSKRLTLVVLAMLFVMFVVFIALYILEKLAI